MSETTSNDSEPDENSDENVPAYTVTVNNKEYELNEEMRRRIQDRAEREYFHNTRFSCWWKTASQKDAEERDIHEVGDPILVIETEGVMVPWENLDQLELEMQDTSSFDGFDEGGSDSGGGMKTLKPDDGDDDSEEKNRTHFELTPQDFEEVPSPDGEDPDRVPAKPQQFDSPNMVTMIPEHPDIDHVWDAGEALAPVTSWVEWNVQARAEQPRPTREKDDSHDHWESLFKSAECEVVSEVESESEQTDEKGESGSAKRKGDEFENGKYGGSNWNV